MIFGIQLLNFQIFYRQRKLAENWKISETTWTQVEFRWFESKCISYFIFSFLCEKSSIRNWQYSLHLLHWQFYHLFNVNNFRNQSLSSMFKCWKLFCVVSRCLIGSKTAFNGSRCFVHYFMLTYPIKNVFFSFSGSILHFQSIYKLHHFKKKKTMTCHDGMNAMKIGLIYSEPNAHFKSLLHEQNQNYEKKMKIEEKKLNMCR